MLRNGQGLIAIVQLLGQINDSPTSFSNFLRFKKINGFPQNTAQIGAVNLVDDQQTVPILRLGDRSRQPAGFHAKPQALVLHVGADPCDERLVGHSRMELDRLAMPAELLPKYRVRCQRLAGSWRPLQHDESPLAEQLHQFLLAGFWEHMGADIVLELRHLVCGSL